MVAVRKIVSSLIVLMLVTSSAFSAVLVNVRAKTWGSSTSIAQLKHLSIPRHQIGCTNEDDEVVITSNAYPYGDRILTFIDDYEESPLTPVVVDQSGTPFVNDHSHTWMKGDTAYISWIDSSAQLQLRAYRCNGTSATRLFTYVIPYTNVSGGIHVAPIAQIGSTDSMVMVIRSRGDEVPSVHNVKYFLSADAGQTWTYIGYVHDWTAHNSRIRIGLEKYDNSVALVMDSADQWILCAKFNRDGGNGSWTHLGHSSNVPSGGYRAFGAGTFRGDTTLVTWLINDDCGSTFIDSCYSSRKDKGAGSWTNMTPFAMSTADYAQPPYTAGSYIEASRRFVLFYTKNTDGNVNNTTIMMRFIDSTMTDWSDEYEVDTRSGRGSESFRVSAPAYVPAVYGDKTYVDFAADSVSGVTTYHLGVLAEVSFTELTDTITIDTLPWVIRAADSFKVHVAGSHLLESDSIGIYFENGVHDVVVDFNDDTLRWGMAGIAGSGLTLQPDGSYEISSDGGGRAQWGINFRNASVWNVDLRNIVFDHGISDALADSATFPTVACAIRGGSGMVNLTVDGCDFKVKGRNSKLIYIDNSGDCSYNIYLKHNIWRNYMHSFRRRDQWNRQSGICFFETNSTEELHGIPFQYHLKIEACSTAVAYWTNLHLQGDSTVADIVDNYWETDGWNLLQDRINDTYDNCTENYCIAIRQSADFGPYEGQRIKIRNNRVRSGTAHAGGRGIFISGVDGPNYNYVDSCVALYDNDIRTHGGFDGYVSFHDALRMRDDWSNVRITDNWIQNTGYGTPPNGSYSDGPHGVIRLTENTGSKLYLRGNTIVGAMEGSFTFNESNGESGVGVSCIVTDECDNQSQDIYVDSNRFITNNMVFDMGFGNGQGGNFTSLSGNRFEFYGGQSSNSSQEYIWYSGISWHNTENSFYNYLADCIFDSSWNETHLYLSDAQDDSLHVGLKYTVPVTVVDGSADPVPGASVTVTDGYGHVVASGTTDGLGKFSAVLKTLDYFNATWDDNVGDPDAVDSTGFNPYVFHASYSGDTDDSTYAVSSTAKSITLTLGTTIAPNPPPSISLRRGLNLRRGVNIGDIEAGQGNGITDFNNDPVDPEP